MAFKMKKPSGFKKSIGDKVGGAIDSIAGSNTGKAALAIGGVLLADKILDRIKKRRFQKNPRKYF
tara:strand:+ start:49 stop:243 length:195 start_codon:yes stop_codon:yes gene_type:complete